ncbi:hypothetical protein [Streptomyces sp. KR80]|uniref:hypothetical protein n=1 Tax=Streptomyces sp. KR80 TaxID=3457426 RepID=UPI003FD6B8C1
MAGGTVLDDEARPGTAGGGDSVARSGPRHAAPKKSLFTKFHMPAGKAIALAAMPTAVFVGMGLTPKLALADETPTNPFAPGPCVTRSDEPREEASPSASESKKPKPSESAKPSEKPGLLPEPSETGSVGGGLDKDLDLPKPEASSSEDPAAKPSAEPTPEESESKNPLDPLGLGDKIKDIFDGPDEEPAPTESSSSPAPKPSSSTAAPKPDLPAAKPAEEVADQVEKTGKDAADQSKEAIKDAADQVGAKVEDLKKNVDKTVDGLKGSAESAKPGAAADGKDQDGKEPFPCPTRDPKALAAADLEPGVPLLPDESWRLESSKLTLRGLDFKGIVEVKTYSGKVKKVLKFTADETDIENLHQLVVGPKGTTAHVEARKGSTSTIRGGTVTMYTEELKGNLFGLIPVTFSPETPPPLNVPFAFFTNVNVVQAGQFGGTLTVPGLHSFSTGD